MQMLEGVVKNYDWGSHTVIPDLLGRPVDGRPWAELWLGAHPLAPSLVGCDARPLDQLIAEDPSASLGPEVSDEFGGLPFLLKVIAAAEPLSIQAHPSIQQAVAGFETEEAAGLAVDAPNRSFRDRNHKPELLCAITRFDALCGFREPESTLQLLRTIPTDALDPLRELLVRPDALEGLLGWILSLSADDATTLVDDVVGACQRSSSGEWSTERQMVVDLDSRHPGDAGVITALLLNHVALEPGDAIFLAAGSLHSYLRGTGVELMANSDNVLRGGLTTKHVDVPNLLEVVDAVPSVPRVQSPSSDSSTTRYESPVAEFSLRRLVVDEEVSLEAGPAIVLCTEGCVDVGDQTLDRGSAVWVPASDEVVVASGHGTVFRAGVGQVG